MKSYVKVSIAISSVLNCGKAPNTAGCLDTDVSINIFSPPIPSALPCVTIALPLPFPYIIYLTYFSIFSCICLSPQLPHPQ